MDMDYTSGLRSEMVMDGLASGDASKRAAFAGETIGGDTVGLDRVAGRVDELIRTGGLAHAGGDGIGVLERGEPCPLG